MLAEPPGCRYCIPGRIMRRPVEGERTTMNALFAGPPAEPWSLQNYRTYLKDHEPHNRKTFEAVVDTMTNDFGSKWEASKATHPAGWFRLHRSGQRIGKVYFPHYDLQGATMEIELLSLSKLAEQDRPSPSAIDAFLDDLASVKAFAEKAQVMREDLFMHRRPDIPLSKIDPESARKGLLALRHLV